MRRIVTSLAPGRNQRSAATTATRSSSKTGAVATITPFTATATGTYYVLVTAWDEMDTGPYTVSVATGTVMLKTAPKVTDKPRGLLGLVR